MLKNLLTSILGILLPQSCTPQTVPALGKKLAQRAMGRPKFFGQVLLLTALGVGGEMKAQDIFVNPSGTCSGGTPCFTTLQAAINSATGGEVIQLEANITEGLVTINKAITLDGGGFTLTSNSATWGIVADFTGVTIQNITVVDAGTFGIIAECGADNLTLTNVTVNSCGGTGIALNGSDNLVLTDITSTNNVGNGISIQDCDNVSITNLTTNGNAFTGGFSAGVGIFSSGSSCPPAGTTNVTIGGTVSIGEPVAVYEQASSGTITGTNVNAASLTHFAGIAGGDKYYAANLATAYSFAAALIDAGAPAAVVHVEEISSGNKYVNDDIPNPTEPPATIGLSINAAITYAMPGKMVFIEDGTYSERVIVTKSLTLDGQSETGTILDGTGLTGVGSGIYINNGVTNVTIQDLTVRDYAGSSPNLYAGIYAIGGSNNLTVQNVTLADNVGGSGFYANGPIDNVLIDNVEAYGHTNAFGAARGIVIWNGLKSNITITNCDVYNNNCCGIELQDGNASGVTMSNNNVYDNGDSGMSAVGLNGSVGSNTISGNILTNNGRFGIEIKNPDGATTVAGNTVTLTNPPADARDLAGIAVFRRGVLAGNVDVPTGVTISGNSVSGYVQTNMGSNSEGFGIVIEGTNHTVSGNSVGGNDVDIQQQQNPSGYPGDANQTNMVDMFFGRGNSPITCGNVFESNGAVERNVGGPFGSGFVTNNNTGETFCSIQAGIDDAQTLSSHTLAVTSGEYTEDVDAATGGKDITLAPGASPGCVTINGDLTLNTGDVLDIEVDGPTACTEYDQLIVTGTVDLGGASLNLILNYLPNGSEPITIIDGSSAITGTFAEGSSITVGSNTYNIDYAGGLDGFDVVLSLECGNDCPGPITRIGSATLDSQADVNAFLDGSNCKFTQMTGNLTIIGNTGSDPITNLCNLNQLQSISGNLIIRNFNDPLNPTNLSELSSLTTIGGSLTIGGSAVQSNTVLTDVSLPALASVGMAAGTGSLTISFNDVLTDVQLPALANVGRDINIRNNTVIENISLGNNAAIGRDFIIFNNNSAALTTVAASVTSIGRDLTFDNNNNGSGAAVTLSGLTTVGDDFSIDDMASAITLTGGCAVAGEVTINNNDNLCDADFSGLQTIGSFFTFTDNYNACGSQSVNFSGLQTVAGYMTFSGNDDMPSLSFDALTAVNGQTGANRSIDIINNDNEMQAISMPALNTALPGEFRVNGNAALTSISAPVLPSIGEDLRLEDNNLVSSIDFSALTTVTGLINIDDEDAVTDLDGFDMLANVNQLTINGNNALTAFSSLTNVTSTLDNLLITNNPALVNLGGLGNLETVGGNMSFVNNDAATTLDGAMGFAVLDVVSGNFSATGNALLGACCVVPCRVEDPMNPGFTDGGGTITVSGNNVPGLCTTLAEAGTACSVQITTCPPPLPIEGCDLADLASGTSLAYQPDAMNPALIDEVDFNLEGGSISLGCDEAEISYWDALQAGACPLTLLRTFTATDNLGNSSSCVQTITIDDTTNPLLSCPADVQVDCPAEVPAAFATLTAFLAGSGSASDECGLDMNSFMHLGDVSDNESCPETIIRSYQVADECGNTAVCSHTITVDDQDVPVIDCPTAPTAQCSITEQPPYADWAAFLAAGGLLVEENCGVNPASFDVDEGTDEGACPETITRTYSIADDCGNIGSCQQIITVDDTELPTMTCPPAATAVCAVSEVPVITLWADFTTADGGASDNCGINELSFGWVMDDSDGNTCPEVVTRTYKVEDDCGNETTCAQIITVDDNTPPTLNCPPALTAQCGIGEQSPYADYMEFTSDNGSASDNCGINALSFDFVVDNSDNQSCPETVTRTYRIEDLCGNAATCTQTITIDDTTPPTANCVTGPVTVELDANGNGTLTAALLDDNSDDNCGIDGMTVLPNAFTCTDLGATTATLTVTDACENEDNCTVTVNVVDNLSPVLVQCPGPVVTVNLSAGNAGGTNTCRAPYEIQNPFTAGYFTDNCPDGRQWSATITGSGCGAPGDIALNSGGAVTRNFRLGNTTVLYTVEDGSNNSNTCQFTITVVDDVPPVITCPDNQTVNADNGLCTYTHGDMTWDATATDNCQAGSGTSCAADPTLSHDFGTPNATLDGAVFNLGPTTVIWTAEDVAGNMTTCAFTVTVEDNQAPSITCPADQTVAADGKCEGEVGDYTSLVTASDNCLANLIVSQSPAAGTLLSGHNDSEIVTLTATDGVQMVSCYLTVTLIDVTPPSITCPADKTVAADENCQGLISNYTDQGIVTDNCGAGNVTVTQSPVAETSLSGHNDMITVTLTATDGNNQMASCTLKVTLLDVTPPVITCPEDHTIAADADCSVEIGSLISLAAVSDNCTSSSAIVVTQDLDETTVLSGHNDSELVTLTADDGNGNTFSCEITVTLLDGTAPTIGCPADQTVAANNDCEGLVGNWTDLATADDNCGSVSVSQTPDPNTILSGHNAMETVTLTADDGNGQTASCTLKVTLVDAMPPTIDCPADQTVAADDNCQALLGDWTASATASDNCAAIVSISQDPIASTLLSGHNDVVTVTLTGSDGNGNSDDCGFTVTLKDVTAPVLTLLGANPLVLCEGTAFVDPGASMTDNCDNPTTVFSNVLVDTDIPGVYTLPYNYTDLAGNPAMTVTRTVIVNAAPQVTIVADPDGDICLGTLDVQYTAVVTPASPNTGSYSYAWCAYNNGAGSGSCFGGFMPGGDAPVQTRSWTAGTGPRSVGVTVTLAGCPAATDLHVFEILPNPTASISGNATICSGQNTDITFSGTPNATVTYTVNGGSPQNILLDGIGQATLNSGPLTATTTYALVSVSIGTDPVCTTVLTAAVTVTVEDAPALDCAGIEDVTTSTNLSDCFATLEWDHPSYTTSPSCGVVATVTYSAGIPAPVTLPVSGAFSSGIAENQDFAVGQTIVTYTITDQFGNNTSECSFSVTVTDDEAPVINCPPLVTVGTDLDECGAVVTYMVTASDNCDYTLTQTAGPESGEFFPAGTTTVSFEVTDPGGLTTACEFDVVVTDTQLPTITCPGDISVSNDQGLCTAVVTYGIQVDDNCPGVTFVRTGGQNSGTAFPVGSTIVSYEATDAAGLTSACSFTVNVSDTEMPVITCPASITVSNTIGLCAAVVNYTVTLTDNCGATLTQTAGLASGASFPLGTTLNIFSASDAAGNSTACSFTVTVNDTQFPTIICPDDMTVGTDDGECDAVVVYPGVTGGDNCPGAVIAQIEGLESGQAFLPGSTLNVYKITDGAGNMTTCDFTVTVVDDEFPVFTSCPTGVTVSNDAGECGADVTYIVTASDNCSVSITQTAGLPSGAFFPIGTTQVSWVASDPSNNVSTCSFTVTVNDAELPTINCPSNITINNDPGVCGAVVDYSVPGVTFDDNCPGETLLQTAGLSSGALFPVGTTNNVYRVTDASNNTATCAFTVQVFDAEAPVMSCPQNITVNNTLNLCEAVVTFTVSATDNCTNPILPVQTGGLASGTAFPVGVTTNTFQAMDMAGNSTVCVFTVTVLDNQLPTISCPADFTISTDMGVCNAVVTYPGITGNDNCPGFNVVQDLGLPSGAVFPLGPTVNVYKITDASMNMRTCAFTVTVLDVTPPNFIACPADATVGTDAGECSAVVNYTVEATDGCGLMLDLVSGLASGSAFPLGENIVIWTAVDPSNNVTTCEFTITVEDDELPTISCPANITANNDAGVCGAVLQYPGVTFNDNCTGFTVQQTGGLAGGSFFPVGITTNEYKVTDGSGNMTTCAFTVQVFDNEAPVLTCPTAIQVNNELGECFATVNYTVAATDNCDGTVTPTLEGGLPSGSDFPVGQTTVTYEAVDMASNVTTCIFVVNVIDNELPTISCPADFTVSTDPGMCNAVVNYPGVTGDDNCPGFSISQTGGLVSGATYPVGATTNSFLITDAANNTSTCAFTVTVLDNTPPVFTACPVNATVNTDPGVCGAVVPYTVSASDNCQFTLIRTQGPASGSVFPVGATQVSWLATDASNNSTVCAFTITVNDNELPVITCPADISVANTTGLCSAVVSFVGATATDNCPGVSVAQTAGLFSGSAFPVGNTVVVFRATDASNNTSTCSFNVSVSDTELPVLSCPQNISVNNELGLCSRVVDYTVTVSDNCPGATWTQTNGLPSGSDFPVGVHTLNFEAEDAAGNTTACSFTITVRDAELPVAICPANIEVDADAGECDAVVNYVGVQATDNCPGVSIAQTGGLLSGAAYPIGTTTNTFLATDAAGNTSACAFTVTVVDTEDPVFTACPPAVINRNNDPGVCGSEIVYTVTATDNCGFELVQVEGLLSGSIFPIGSTPNLFVVTDDYGNTAECSFTVNVLDTELPVITCHADITVNNDEDECGAIVTFIGATGSDNCPGFSIAQTGGPVSGSLFPVGITAVTYKITDASNNMATCSFNVQVFDAQFPNVSCPQPVIRPNDLGQCSATYIYDVIFSDNCPGATITQTAGIASGGAFPVGTTNNVFAVTDAAGNTSFCSFTVTVLDLELPTVTCPANVEQSNDPDVCGAIVTFAGVMSDDNCPGEFVTQIGGSISGALYPIGTTTNVYRVQDAAGNSTTCAFTITINDTQFPVFTSCPPTATRANDPGVCGAEINYTVTATDNCAFTVTQTAGLPSGSIFPIGMTPVSYTAVDASGNVTTCAFTVTVNDTELPAITCPDDISVFTDEGECSAVVTFNGATANDNCPNGLTVAQTGGLTSGSAFPVGSTVVEYTATDASGNTSACEFIIEVMDNELPVITCPNDVTISNDLGLCSAVYNYTVTVTDNCPGAGYTQTAGLPSGSAFPVGVNTLGFEAEDAAGNTADCSFTITVRDAELPTVTCPPSQTVSNDPDVCGAVVTYTGVLFDDNCPGEIITQIGGLPSGALYPIGTTTNLYRVEDAAGNSTTCAFTITVNDTQFPVFTSCPPSATRANDPGVCGAVVNYMVVATDNCDYTVTQTAGLPGGSIFPIGMTPVSYTAVDASGNATTCAFTVTVSDTELPVITCPDDISVFNDPGECSAVVNFNGASATDNCPNVAVNQTGGLAGGSAFPVGPTVIEYTATDAGGNTSACEFIIQVSDNELPVIMCPSNVTISNDLNECSAVYNYTVTVTDNCPGAGYTQTAGLPSGSAFPVGINTLGFEAEDAAGNTANCSFTITVRDAELPSITCPPSQEVNNAPGLCSAVVTYPGVLFDDNCPGEIITQINGLISGATYPVGVTTNVYRVTDASGNSTTCAFTITVLDTEFPTISCPGNAVRVNDPGQCGAVVNYMVTSSDNCAGTLTQTTGLPSGALFPVGMTTNTFTVVDASGNATSCVFTVTVSDTEPPQIACPADLSVDGCDLDAILEVSNLPYSETTAAISLQEFQAEGGTATDNCGEIASITYADLAAGSCPTIVTRTFTVTDEGGVSTTCIQQITVDDVTLPTISCPATVLICSDPIDKTAVVDDIQPLSSGDNCNYTVTFEISGNTTGSGSDDAGGSTFNNGLNVVTYYATDDCGNVGVCSFEVRVRRTPRPRFVPNTVNICNGQSIDLATYVDDQNNAAKRYDFYLGNPFGGGTFLGSITATNGNPDPGQTLVVTPAGDPDEPVTYQYYVVGANTFNNGPNCLNAGGPLTVTVNPIPLGLGTPNLMTCSDVPLNIDLTTMILTDPTGVTFSWVAADNPRISGESLTPQSGPVINDILTNIWVLDTSVFYTVTPTGLNGCAGTPFTVQVLVKREPEGKASLTSQVVCSGTPITPIELTAGNGVPGTTFTWTRNNLANITGIPSSGSGTPITGTPRNITNQNRTTTFTIIPTGGNGCVGDPFTVTVTVRPEPVVIASPVSQAVCSGAPIQVINIGYLNSVSGSTFSWSRNNTVNVTGLPNAGNAGTISGNPLNLTGQPQTTTYAIVPVSGAGCVGDTAFAAVSVLEEPVGSDDDATACNGLPFSYDLQNNLNTLGNGVTSDFTWVAVADNPDVTGESLSPQMGDFINDVLVNTSNVPQQVVYSVTPNGGNCEGESFLVTVTVILDDQVPPVIADCPDDLSIEGCSTADIPGLPFSTDVTEISLEDFEAAGGSASDNCALDPVATYQDAATGSCPITVTRTFTVYDQSGYATSCVQTILIDDNTPPTFTGPADMTLSCEQDPDDLGLTGEPTDAADNCGQVSVDYADDRSGLTGCNGTGTIVRTWIALDGCQNTSAYEQIITVIDITPPTFNPDCQFQPVNLYTSDGVDCPAEAGISLDPGDILSPFNNWIVAGFEVDNLAGCLSDNCSAEENIVIEVISVEVDDELLPCRRSFRVTFEIRDACGNAQPQPFVCVYNIIEDSAPIFSAPADLTISCEQDPNDLQLTGEVTQAFDDCFTGLLIDFEDDLSGLTGCSGTGTLLRTWSVTDGCGNTAYDTQTITIQDIQAPVFANVPANLTVECSAVPDPATPTATDNCDADVAIDYLGDQRTDGNCADSYVLTRRWVAVDDCGNATTAVQIITVRDTQAPTFSNVPADMTVECDDVPAPGTPTAVDNCDDEVNIVYNGQTRQNGNCPHAYTLTRSWSAIDNCGNSTLAVQTIAVIDTTPPTFTAPADVTVYTRGDCSYDANIQITGDVTNEADNCSGALQAVFTADTIPGTGNQTLRIIRRFWTLQDSCNNMSPVQTQLIYIQDTLRPVIICPNNITLQADPTNCTQTLNELFVQASDNCGSVNLSYTISGATTGSGSGAPIGVTFNAGLSTVILTATDAAGNSAGCSFTVSVVNCPVMLKGRITWEHNNGPVPNATVTVTGDFNNFDITDLNGNYDFTILNGSNFVITPTKPINPLNGVTTADGLAIFQHVSGGAQLPAPFKRIAADVQKDNDIDNADANVIFQALQGNAQALQTMASSWRFIPKSYTFPNPNAPWNFPENIVLNGAGGVVNNLDFHGVKLGDVTGDANPALRPGPPVVFQAQDQLLQAGTAITVEIRAKDFEALTAWQTAFGFNPEVIAYAGLEFPSDNVLGLTEAANFGLYDVAKGQIRALWYSLDARTLSDDTPLFRLHFQVLQGGQMLSQVLQFKPSVLENLCFDAELAQGSLELQYTDATTSLDVVQAAGIELFQNRPNPFTEKTTISFTLPAACDAQLRILSVDGRELWRYDGFFPAGYNEVDFLLHDRLQTGVLYYELTTPFGKRAKRMIAVGK